MSKSINKIFPSPHVRLLTNVILSTLYEMFPQYIVIAILSQQLGEPSKIGMLLHRLGMLFPCRFDHDLANNTFTVHIRWVGSTV